MIKQVYYCDRCERDFDKQDMIPVRDDGEGWTLTYHGGGNKHYCSTGCLLEALLETLSAIEKLRTKTNEG